MTLEFRNQPKGGVLVKKVDAVTNAPISDVEFLVTDSDGNLIGNANGKFVTDSAGTFTITDIIPDTTLIIKETRTKDGYILDDTPQTVKVKSNEVVTVEFRNQPKGNLIVVKQDSMPMAPMWMPIAARFPPPACTGRTRTARSPSPVFPARW